MNGLKRCIFSGTNKFKLEYALKVVTAAEGRKGFRLRDPDSGIEKVFKALATR